VLYRRGEFERARFYIRRVNNVPELSNAETLWLAARIEHKMGNRAGVNDFGNRLRNRFPNARETGLFDRGLFND
jgi:type IV pilus assembly protein PilF